MSQLATTLTAWLLEPATGQLEPTALLDGLVQRLAELDLQRIAMWIPTKHPELWGSQLSGTRAPAPRSSGGVTTPPPPTTS